MWERERERERKLKYIQKEILILFAPCKHLIKSGGKGQIKSGMDYTQTHDQIDNLYWNDEDARAVDQYWNKPH